jgi:hypothetical protein
MEHGYTVIRMVGTRIKDQDTIVNLIPLCDTLLSKLAEWLSIFTRLDCKVSTLEICASSNLLMYHGVALIWLSTHLSSVQTTFGNDNSRFENIVHHADIILAHQKTRNRPSRSKWGSSHLSTSSQSNADTQQSAAGPCHCSRKRLSGRGRGGRYPRQEL